MNADSASFHADNKLPSIHTLFALCNPQNPSPQNASLQNATFSAEVPILHHKQFHHARENADYQRETLHRDKGEDSYGAKQRERFYVESSPSQRLKQIRVLPSSSIIESPSMTVQTFKWPSESPERTRWQESPSFSSADAENTSASLPSFQGTQSTIMDPELTISVDPESIRIRKLVFNQPLQFNAPVNRRNPTIGEIVAQYVSQLERRNSYWDRKEIERKRRKKTMTHSLDEILTRVSEGRACKLRIPVAKDANSHSAHQNGSGSGNE